MNVRVAGCGDGCDTDLYALFLSATSSSLPPSVRVPPDTDEANTRESRSGGKTPLLGIHAANGTPCEGESYFFFLILRPAVLGGRAVQPASIHSPVRLLQVSVCLS